MATTRERGSGGDEHGSKHRKRVMMLISATAVLLVVTAGVVVAVGGRRPERGRAAMSPAATLSPVADPSVVVTPRHQKHEPPSAPSPTEPSPVETESPAPVDPYALSDGTYPTFIRGVDVEGARVTVDVLQLFKHHAAFRAAVQDGMRHREARYLSVYLRNENPLLRTLPVAPDVKIHFLGACDVPPNRHIALTQLQDATTPFDKTFYYSVAVREGVVHWVAQHLAIPAC